MNLPTRALILPLFLGALLAPTFSVSAATSMPTTDLSLGAQGATVTWLQEFLIAKNIGAAAASLKEVGATGYFGTRTRAALAEFQTARGITPAHGYFGAKTRAAIESEPVSMHAPTFSGKIEAVNAGCFADGICSVTIDGKEVILLAGLRMDPPPVGSLKGVASIGDLEGKIGATANVYATTTTEGDADYTLYGSTEYYVEVLPAVPAGEPITVTGTIGCLPPKDPSKPTIALCAFGIKADTGKYYALSMKDGMELANYDTEARVEVTGTFVAGADLTWNSIGTITVSAIKEL